MQWSTKTRIAAIVCGTCLLLGAIAGAVVSGAKLDAGDLISAILGGLGTLLGGLGLAAGPSPGRGGGAAALALFIVLGATGCSGSQISHDDACETQHAVVSALGAGLEAADAAPGTEGQVWDDTLRYARGVAALGRAATSGCELHRDGAGWQEWVGLALEAAVGVAAVFGAAGDDGPPSEPPPELERAQALLRAELATR